MYEQCTQTTTTNTSSPAQISRSVERCETFDQSIGIWWFSWKRRKGDLFLGRNTHMRMTQLQGRGVQEVGTSVTSDETITCRWQLLVSTFKSFLFRDEANLTTSACLWKSLVSSFDVDFFAQVAPPLELPIWSQSKLSTFVRVCYHCVKYANERKTLIYWG